MTPSRELLSLPAYAWDKSRWWHESGELRDGRLARVAKVCSTSACRAPRRPGRRGSTAATWPSSRITRWTPTSFSRPPALWKWCWKPACSCSRDAPFAIEDFEIRKPLILPEPASGVVLELTYEPAERTFTIQSRFEQAASWSVHVVGSMRSERTESSFAASAWEAPGAELGAGRCRPVLRPHERPRTSLRRRVPADPRIGRRRRQIRRPGVACPKQSQAGAAEYALHPVLLDGALQVFSAGAKTVEDRQAKMKLPVRFARILFLRSPGRVRAGPRAGAAFQRGTDRRPDRPLRRGRPSVRARRRLPRDQHDRSARRAGASGGGRDLLYHVDWERTASDDVAPSRATAGAVGATPGRRQRRAGRSHRPARPRRTRSRHGRRGRSGRRAARPRSAGDGCRSVGRRSPPTRSASPRRCGRSLSG